MIGQDVHFSQTASNTLIFNPANTGNFYGSWRFGHNLRSQWKAIGQPYNTISLSFDKPFLLANRKFSAGIYLLDDKSGVIGLHKSGLLLSVASQFFILHGILRLGVQGGLFNLSYDLNGATVPIQYDHSIGAFNSDLQYFEPNLGESKLYPDINAGFAYQVLLGKYNTEIGAAVFHINRPNNSFFESNKLDMTYKGHLEINFAVGEKIRINPATYFIYMAHASNLMLGSRVELDVPRNQSRLHSIFAGTYIRTGFDRTTDAIIALIGANLFQFRIGLSYDINISELQQATHNRGAFELSIVYTGLGRKINPSMIPCFRQ